MSESTIEAEISTRPGAGMLATLETDGTVQVEVKGTPDCCEEWRAMEQALQHLATRAGHAIEHGGRWYEPEDAGTEYDPWGEA